MAVKHGQQTSRFSETIRLIGYALGGEAGCRLAKRLSIRTSPDTVLRRVKQKSIPESVPPKYVGIDDWAWRKGQRYGSILVDLETHRPLDLLSDRSADSFAAWLKQHPTVEIISRDRAEAYADGATRGAPNATQVADRFHLLCNLTSAVERVLESKRSELSKAFESEESQYPPLTAIKEQPSKSSAQRRSEERRECRLERFNQVTTVHRQGMNKKAIAQTLQIGRKTVARFLRSGQFPERATPRRHAPRVNHFRTYIESRWVEGCHNATQLWHEIQSKGYAGGRRMVARLVATLRTPGTKYHRKLSSPPKTKSKRLSPRQTAMLMARRPEKLDASEKQLIDRLEKCCPAVANLRPLVRSFSAVFQNKDAAALQPWIEQANSLGLPSSPSAMAF